MVRQLLTILSSLVCTSDDDPWHKAVGGRVATRGFRALGPAVVIRANLELMEGNRISMMWATWSDEANTSPVSSTSTWECTCVPVCLWCVGLTESPGRVNGIRLTCVIQLGCGREVCPHPSAGGDKEPGEGGERGERGPFHHFTGNSTKFQFQSVCLPWTDLFFRLWHWQKVEKRLQSMLE